MAIQSAKNPKNWVAYMANGHSACGYIAQLYSQICLAMQLRARYIWLVNIRKSHLRKTYLGGLPEVGLPESINHQKVPPQLLCIICTVFALQDSFELAR